MFYDRSPFAGGSMADLISADLSRLQIDARCWKRVHFFYCDERLVPLDHVDSTHKLYVDRLYGPLKALLPNENIHAVRTDLPGRYDYTTVTNRP